MDEIKEHPVHRGWEWQKTIQSLEHTLGLGAEHPLVKHAHEIAESDQDYADAETLS